MKALKILIILFIMLRLSPETVRASSPGIKEEQGFTFDAGSINYIYVISVPISSDSTLTKLHGRFTIPDSGIGETFNCKIAVFVVNTPSAKSGHNSHSKKKIKPYVSHNTTLTDKWWYQLLGHSFSSSMHSSYRYVDVPRR